MNENNYTPYAETTENIGEVNRYSSNVPSFNDKWEENEYCHKIIAESLNNISERLNSIEGFLSKFPEPGADMIKYKPKDKETHLNIKELFDDLYLRLNRIEEVTDAR